MSRAFVVWIALASCGDNQAVTFDAAIDASPIDAPPMIDAFAGVPATLQLDMATASFGTLLVASSSAAIVVTITNAGEQSTGALALSVTGLGASSFSTAGTTCAQALAPAASCTVPIVFAPQTVGAKGATLRIAGRSGGQVTALLDGTAIAAGPGALSISATTNQLPDEVIGGFGTTASTFTVTNLGSADTGTLTVVGAGAHPSDFVIDDHCTTRTLVPGATCTFAVRFAPKARGQRTSEIVVGAAPGGVVIGAITARGLLPATIALPFGAIDFGRVRTGATATTRITLENRGDAPTIPIAVTFAGGSGFVLAGGTCPNFVIPAHSTCTLDVALTAATAGRRNSTVTFIAGNTVVVLVTGDITGDQLAITPSSFGFPNTLVSGSSAPQMFTVTNHGVTATTALATTITHASFHALADGCTGATLAPNASCTISVEYNPSDAGARYGRIDVAAATGGIASASLRGFADIPAKLVIARASHDFGSVPVGAIAEFSITLSNAGRLASDVPAISVDGASASEVMVAHTCTAALLPDQACTITLRFAPTSAGSKSATLHASAAPGGTVTATLAGTAIAAGGLTITPSSFVYEPTAVNDGAAPDTFSATQAFVIRNTGATPISTLAVSGSGELAIANLCGPNLAAGASCTVTARFHPTVVGPAIAAITATDGSRTAAAAVGALGMPRLEITAIDDRPASTSFDFGTQRIGAAIPADAYLTLTNHTERQLLVYARVMPAPFVFVRDNCQSVMRTFGTCVVQVRFAPTVAGPAVQSATFSMTNNLQLTGPWEDAFIELRGTGAP